MTPADLYYLIQSDAHASAYYSQGNDESCAKRCSDIAPTLRKPVDASKVQEIASLNGLWGMLKIAALDSTLGNPPRGAAVAFIDWIEQNRPMNPDNPSIMQMASLLVQHGLATNEQIQEIVSASNVKQTITSHAIGEARQWSIANGSS